MVTDSVLVSRLQLLVELFELCLNVVEIKVCSVHLKLEFCGGIALRIEILLNSFCSLNNNNISLFSDFYSLFSFSSYSLDSHLLHITSLKLRSIHTYTEIFFCIKFQKDLDIVRCANTIIIFKYQLEVNLK